MYINSLSLVWEQSLETVWVSTLIKYFFWADPFVKPWEQDSCEEWLPIPWDALFYIKPAVQAQ